MKRVLQTIGLSLALTGAAVAQSFGGDARFGGDAEYDWARVVRVDPIIENFEEPVERDVCRSEPVEYYEPRYAYRDGDPRNGAGGAVLGAIIGGALGNQVGSGDGRRAATVAGALIGGTVGHNRATRGGYREVAGNYRQSSERVCETRVDFQRREQVIGYNVAYEYNGRTYNTRTDAHPGDRIQVAVSVAPVL